MGLGRYVVEAVLLEGRSPTEIAGSHGISRSWIYELVRRFREGGYEALEPRSRRPHSCSHQVSADVQAAILGLRQELIAAGHDAGARTIAHHLQPLVEQVPSTATIWRILCRQGQITPQPRKRPKSSLHRFQAALPNELWQLDITYWQLTGGRHAEILNLIDDHSRLLLASDAFFTVKAADVVETFHLAGQSHGFPAALLSDNGAVFAGRPRRGKVLLESELQRLGIACKHSLPNLRPAARSNACIRHSNASSTNRLQLVRWPISSSSWMPSAPTTTRSDLTARPAVRRPWLPSTLASKPGRP